MGCAVPQVYSRPLARRRVWRVTGGHTPRRRYRASDSSARHALLDARTEPTGSRTSQPARDPESRTRSPHDRWARCLADRHVLRVPVPSLSIAYYSLLYPTNTANYVPVPPVGPAQRDNAPAAHSSCQSLTALLDGTRVRCSIPTPNPAYFILARVVSHRVVCIPEPYDHTTSCYHCHIRPRPHGHASVRPCSNIFRRCTLAHKHSSLPRDGENYILERATGVPLAPRALTLTS